MGQLGSKLRRAVSDDYKTQYLSFFCPGCELMHTIKVNGLHSWGWDGRVEDPTFSPSILVTGGEGGIRCHSFVTAGVIRFLADCSHRLAGQQVPMPPLPPVYQDDPNGQDILNGA